MKTLTEDGLYWTEPTDKDGVFLVGITPHFQSKMGVVWSFIPRKSKTLTKGTTFANIESSKCLMPLRSPIGGHILEWNEKLFKCPEKLDSTTYLMMVGK